jgi:hypothetical protein
MVPFANSSRMRASDKIMMKLVKFANANVPRSCRLEMCRAIANANVLL